MSRSRALLLPALLVPALLSPRLAHASPIDATHALLEKSGMSLDDIDLFFFHQANLRINQYVAELLKLPADKVPHNIERYGNTTAATLPILLAEAVDDGRLRPGAKIALVAFGSGFTWGSAIIDW